MRWLQIVFTSGLVILAFDGNFGDGAVTTTTTKPTIKSTTKMTTKSIETTKAPVCNSIKFHFCIIPCFLPLLNSSPHSLENKKKYMFISDEDIIILLCFIIMKS